MYALPNKTQHKLIVKVRGGITQKLDNLTSQTQQSANSSSFDSGRNKSSKSSFLKKSPTSSQSSTFDQSSPPQPIFHPIHHNGNKQRSSNQQRAQKQQYITPEHNEMIKYVQQSWKGVERDYKNSVNNYINKIDLKQKQTNAKRKTATSSTPLLLSGSYHHTSGTKDSFQPFDLETFWGNRILKRLTEETI